MTTRGHNTRPNFAAYKLKTDIDVEHREFRVHVPFASDDLPYYPVLVAALIAGCSPTSMYAALGKGRWGLEGVKIEGVAHITHDSLVTYVQRRDESAETAIARKRQAVVKMKPAVPRRRPSAPKPVSATPSAQHLIDTGSMDFLNGLLDEPAE